MQKTLQRVIIATLLLIGQPLYAFAQLNNVFSSPYSSDVFDITKHTLQSLSLKERNSLRTLFLYFLKYDNLGHVIFGKTKPACFGSFNKTKQSKRDKILMQGWECLKELVNKMPFSNFLFIEEEQIVADETILCIFVINKKTFISFAHDKIAYFKEKLGPGFHPETFLLKIEEQQTLRTVLGYDEALFGVLLGFGIDASTAFKEKNAGVDKSSDWEAPEWTSDYTGIDIVAPKNATLYSVGFMGNPQSEEVQYLVKQYEEEMNAIWTICSRSNNLLFLLLSALQK